LKIGSDWNAFRLSPLTLTVNFPSIFLAKAPQLFQPPVFHDGILSGSVSLSETLEHPRIDGDIQLLNGKLSGDSSAVNLTEASGRMVFGGNRASIEFLNIATQDAELSLGGEIDFQDISNVTIKINGSMPVFDLTARQINCMSRIEFAPAPFTLAPAVAELQFCGGLYEPDWIVALKEHPVTQSIGAADPNEVTREFPLCFQSAATNSSPLVLGTSPRSAQASATPPRRKPTSER
jgi:hypothetical protein